MHLSALLGVSQAATGSLVAAVWQGFLLAVAAWAGLRLLPKTPAAVRFAIWFAVFLVVAALPAISLWPHAGAARAGGHGAWLTLDSRWCLAIAAVWAIASLVRAATLVVAAFRVRALWKRAEPVKHPGLGQMGARAAQICVSDEVDRPSVIGFFSPKILIPRWLIEKLTAEELRQIVLHEAGHLHRADDWVNLVQKIALVVFPLNPALVWVERRLCFERELACDERVLRTTGAPKAYAACLASLAESRLGRRGLALSLGALGRESELGRRVRRILGRGERMRPVHARLVLAGAMLGLLVGSVELARCPQLVAFSGQGVENRVQASAGSGFRAEAVVFHPEVARSQSGLEPTHRDAAAMDGAPRMVTARQAIVARPHVAGVRRGLPGSGASDQMVVLSSWDGGDGTRVVLTAAHVEDGVATGLRVVRVVDQPSEFHRYAAVATRDGWLVFQL
jgi:BlaR1 peptidase M56